LSRFAGIIPVLAIQGAAYIAAGIAMFVCLKDDPGPGDLRPVGDEGIPAVTDPDLMADRRDVSLAQS